MAESMAPDMPSPSPILTSKRARGKARQMAAFERRLKGETGPIIAEALGVSLRTVKRDLAIVLLEISEANAANEVQRRTLVTERLEALIDAAYPDALNGDGGAYERVLRALAQLCRLHGFDAPQRLKADVTQHTKPDLAALTDQDIAALRAAMSNGAVPHVNGSTS